MLVHRLFAFFGWAWYSVIPEVNVQIALKAAPATGNATQTSPRRENTWAQCRLVASRAKATAHASTQIGASIRIDIITAAAIMARRNITRPNQLSAPSWRKTTLQAARASPVTISSEFGLTAAAQVHGHRRHGHHQTGDGDRPPDPGHGGAERPRHEQRCERGGGEPVRPDDVGHADDQSEGQPVAR